MDYSEVLFFVLSVCLAPWDRLAAGLVAGVGAFCLPAAGPWFLGTALFIGAATDLGFLQRHPVREKFTNDGAPVHLYADTIVLSAKRFPRLTVCLLAVFGFPRKETAGAGYELSDHVFRALFLLSAALGTTLGFGLGFATSDLLWPAPAVPDLLQQIGTAAVMVLLAPVLRLMGARLSHRWREHENSIG